MSRISARSISVGLCLFTCLGAGEVAAGKGRLTLEAIFSPDPNKRIEFGGSPLTDLEWAADGLAYLQPSPSPGDDEAFSPPLRVEVRTGHQEPLLDSLTLVQALEKLDEFTAQDARDLRQDAVSLSPLHNALLIQHADDLFHFSIETGEVRRLTRHPDKEEVARFSPDGRWVAFVRDHDLHVTRIDGEQEAALTADGGPALLNGKLDWVYQEEIYGRGSFRGYWWSPDSQYLAFLQLDESPVHQFTLVDHLPTRSRTETVHYPKAGDPNPIVRLGIVPVGGGAITWVDMASYQASEPLIVRVGWTPDSQRLVYLVQDREQTWLDINTTHRERAQGTTLVHETSPAFVDVDLTGTPHWLEDGSFLWVSGRSGYHHLYRFGSDGQVLGQITDGEWEVRKLHGLDEERGWIYITASEHSPIEDHVYRVRLDGTKLQRLSAANGTHRAQFDDGFSYFLDTWSNVDTPPRVELHRADGRRLRTIDANEVPALEELDLAPVEFLQVPAPDGFVFEAAWIKPVGFDPGERYPVLQYNYGGPHAQTVKNAWGGSRHLWFRYLAQEGFVIWMCDNRSASGKGIWPTWEAYQRLGELELADLETCLSWLERHPWIDAARLGVYGGSYGGFMASFALTHSQRFKVGIAWAPVTDWRLYDTIYTERYMRRPQDNPEGYAATSVIEAADQLHGELLLMHGTMDDNVHLQNTIQLANALQQAGKSFQLMLYPNSRHGVRDQSQIYHLYRLMTRFLMEKL